jgi:hypothetical protein
MIDRRNAENPNAGVNTIFPFVEELNKILQTTVKGLPA